MSGDLTEAEAQKLTAWAARWLEWAAGDPPEGKLPPRFPHWLKSHGKDLEPLCWLTVRLILESDGGDEGTIREIEAFWKARYALARPPARWRLLGTMDAEDPPVEGHCHHCGTAIKKAYVLTDELDELLYVGVCCAAMLTGQGERYLEKKAKVIQSKQLDQQIEEAHARALKLPGWQEFKRAASNLAAFSEMQRWKREYRAGWEGEAQRWKGAKWVLAAKATEATLWQDLDTVRAFRDTLDVPPEVFLGVLAWPAGKEFAPKVFALLDDPELLLKQQIHETERRAWKLPGWRDFERAFYRLCTLIDLEWGRQKGQRWEPTIVSRYGLNWRYELEMAKGWEADDIRTMQAFRDELGASPEVFRKVLEQNRQHCFEEDQSQLVAAVLAKLDAAVPQPAQGHPQSRDEELAVEGFVHAGTPAAFDALGPHESVFCVRCGARISYVFLTSKGPMGGDCLATLTGDPSTRKLARQLSQKLDQVAGYAEIQGLKLTAKTVWAVTLNREVFNEWTGAYGTREKAVLSYRQEQRPLIRALVAFEAESRGWEYHDETSP